MNTFTSSNVKDFICSNAGFKKWYHTIIWWEMFRILYNGIMLFVGLVSSSIAAINIPIIYVLIALILNIFYCFLWITELYDKKELLQEKKIRKFRKKAFAIYLIFSILCVSILPIIVLIGAL